MDRRDYKNKIEKTKKPIVPMKSTQFRAAQTLLDVCQTPAASRPFEPENWAVKPVKNE